MEGEEVGKGREEGGGGEGVRGDGTEKRKGRREGGEKGKKRMQRMKMDEGRREPIRSYRLLKGEQPINLSPTVQIYVVCTYYCVLSPCVLSPCSAF
jgi:hypothetical protein